jgi:hypothetical protein
MRVRQLVSALIAVFVAAGYANTPVSAGSQSGVGGAPQGSQTNTQYANSGLSLHVTNVLATSQSTSCYWPEVTYTASAGPNDGFSGETKCPGATTGEDGGGPYPQQLGSNPGFAVGPSAQVKDHSESDIRVDPTNPKHLIGSVKWFVSAEGYNHLLGFYESFDGGLTWPHQGHIPGYEGFTDNTDPVGAFDGFGNYYELILPYQFYYNSDGSHNFQTNPNKEPNPTVPAEAISIAVRRQGSTTATQWITTHTNAQGVTGPDYIAAYPAKGQEPDKQWITIDTNPASGFYNTIYAMWAVFDGVGSKPFVSTAKALPNGQHTDWSPPVQLPTVNSTASDTYLLPHVAPDGSVYTSVSNFPAMHGFCCTTIYADKSADGGKTWTSLATAVAHVPIPAFVGGYANTTFTDGIDNTFTVGHVPVNGHYPLYIAYNEENNGVSNVMVTASFDGGASWTSPFRVNDNQVAADEFQPSLAVAANGTVSVAFYDRRLACPAAGTAGAAAAGLALDMVNANFSGSLPPYGASNYCVNASIQFYRARLLPIGHNVRLTANTWDPQLNSAFRFCVCEPGAGFIGDYFGNTFNGSTSVTTSVTTVDDSSNPAHYQQQVVAMLPVPQ